MLKKVLVANRGEIAVRIIRECRDSGIEAVAVYSTADEGALHTVIASEAVCIGNPPALESYLNISNLIEAAKRTGCDSIHPGYGFLSESKELALACQENNLKFIGPSVSVMETMGNKSAARKCVQKAGVPVVPGSDGTVDSLDEALTISDKIGFPVLIKASLGGGGKGMRKAENLQQVAKFYGEAKAEAENCFGDGQLYIEKYIVNPRHIEFQILADKFGNTIHLYERECSIQRRNQKLLEESPAWALPKEIREEMGAMAVKAAKAVGYENAGTIEFVLDKDNNFYFIEMNTRIQVEHPVTEMITQVNLVREQLRIAAGLPLDLCQEDIKHEGHAIECRIMAEDVMKNFAPCPGTIDFVHWPGGPDVRVDSCIYNGCQVSPYYDSMIAKIIVKGETRLDAIRKMRRVLEETIITGVETTLPVQYLITYNKDFLRGQYDTGFVGKNLDGILKLYEQAGGNDESL